MSCEEDAENIECDLERLSVWLYGWQMQFNVDHCEDIDSGRNIRKTSYYLNRCKLREVDTQQNLGLQVHHSLPVTRQLQQ